MSFKKPSKRTRYIGDHTKSLLTSSRPLTFSQVSQQRWKRLFHTARGNLKPTTGQFLSKWHFHTGLDSPFLCFNSQNHKHKAQHFPTTLDTEPQDSFLLYVSMCPASTLTVHPCDGTAPHHLPESSAWSLQ